MTNTSSASAAGAQLSLPVEFDPTVGMVIPGLLDCRKKTWTISRKDQSP